MPALLGLRSIRMGLLFPPRIVLLQAGSYETLKDEC
ncbi:hypothetical protein LINGRAHAP2_LOCUS16267 [Linum grandiflorum]